MNSGTLIGNAFPKDAKSVILIMKKKAKSKSKSEIETANTEIPETESSATPEASTSPAIPTTNIDPPENQDEGFNPMTDEAFKWATSQDSIPGAYQPILYFGPKVVIGLSELLKRPLTLEEVKLLARADGEAQVCAFARNSFQPVAYVPYIPNDLLTIKGDLSSVDLPEGGQFYVMKGEKEITPVSGSVYFYNACQDEYGHAHSSPLVTVANAIRKETGKAVWGMSLNRANNLIAGRDARRTASNEMHERARSFASRFAGKSRPNRNDGINPIRDAFSEV